MATYPQAGFIYKTLFAKNALTKISLFAMGSVMLYKKRTQIQIMKVSVICSAYYIA